MDPFWGVIQLPLSLHKYSYAHNNPVNIIDPSGLEAENLTQQQLAQQLQGILHKYHTSKNVKRMQRLLCKVAAGGLGSYGALERLAGFQRHHIVQKTSVRDIFGMTDALGLAIYLAGGSFDQGSPHDNANRSQPRPRGAGTFGRELVIAYRALRKAGCTEDDARKIIAEAEKQFDRLGFTPSTPTNPVR